MIGIFDSGLGGLSVLREIAAILPQEDIVYYADSAHCPYGGKSREYVCDRARAISSFLREKGADIVVVACNTATAAAISTLRSESPDFPFVGMEPAVKPAAHLSGSGVVGVLATAGTLNSGKFHDLCEKYGENVKIVEHIGEGFVELVENGELDGAHAEQVVSKAVRPLVDAGADVIVLGCTHYPFLLPLIQKAAGNGVKIINPAPAVAAHVARLLSQMREGKPFTPGKGRLDFCTSGSSITLRDAVCKLLGLNL